jgi:sodium pump decarboxylase gamma subunit
MSVGQVLLHGLEYTAIGMGTVFCVLIFISFCIMLMGKVLNRAPKASVEAAPVNAEPVENVETAVEEDGVSPEIVAAIMAAIQMKLDGEIGVGGYRLRNIRRAEWRHM